MPTVKTVLLYSISGIALFALAGVAPGFSVFFALLLVMGVLAIHSHDYATMLSQLTNSLGVK